MNRQSKNLILTLLFASILFSCQNKKVKNEHSNHQKAVPAEDCETVHWSHHKGHDGPENWKNLCTGFSDCGGESQSPVNIVKTEVTETDSLPKLSINYKASITDIINNGHTVQFNVSEGSSITIGDKEYQLLQFHYHALSEHTISGEYFPLEVHFVHKHSDSDFAVIGIMYTEGEANELFTNNLEHFPTSKGEYKSEELFDINSILPDNLSYYHYSGSLTTPPCSEVVSWYVLTNTLSASEDQIKNFSDILDNNYRPLMPLNGRSVYRFTEE